MRLRAQIRIRNDHMIEARRAAGLSQKGLAQLSAVPMAIIAAFEALQYRQIHSKSINKHANKLASAMNIPAELILPDGAQYDANTNIEIVREIPIANMMAFKESLALAYQPDDFVVEAEERDELSRALNRLTDREKKIYELRFRQDMDLEKIGRVMNLTRSRVGRLVYRIERKIKKFMSPDPVRDAVTRYDARIAYLRKGSLT